MIILYYTVMIKIKNKMTIIIIIIIIIVIIIIITSSQIRRQMKGKIAGNYLNFLQSDIW